MARYLFDRDLQRQIEQGLNVVESWNRANAIICYGKSGEISTNHREEVEMTALCLRILQASLVFVNTLMLQDVLAEPEWSALLTPVDRRGLSPLFWQHVRPYGEVSAPRGVPRQAPSTDTIGRRVLATRPVRLPAWSVTSRTVRPSGWRRHRICQSLTGSRALICGRAGVAADPVAIGPAAGLAAVIGCCGVWPAVVIRRRAGVRCCG